VQTVRRWPVHFVAISASASLSGSCICANDQLETRVAARMARPTIQSKQQTIARLKVRPDPHSDSDSDSHGRLASLRRLPALSSRLSALTSWPHWALFVVCLLPREGHARECLCLCHAPQCLSERERESVCQPVSVCGPPPAVRV